METVKKSKNSKEKDHNIKKENENVVVRKKTGRRGREKGRRLNEHREQLVKRSKNRKEKEHNIEMITKMPYGMKNMKKTQRH